MVQVGEEASEVSYRSRFCSLESGKCHLLHVNLAAFENCTHEQYIYSSSLFVKESPLVLGFWVLHHGAPYFCKQSYSRFNAGELLGVRWDVK